MNIKTITFAVLLLSTTIAHADNFMMVMGGGGEPTGDTTIFDSTMNTLGDNLKSSDWKYQLSFNGGHAKTIADMTSHYPTPTTPMNDFTPENYKAMIADYTAKINNGTIKSGDQLMIMINTHGAAKGNDKEEIHQIAAAGGTGATDLNNLSGTKLVSVKDLGPLIKLATDKGIKLGVVDLSCHSGNTQEFKKQFPKACIVSATGPKHYGYAGDSAFTGMFMKNLKKGVTLEGAFLKARAETRDASYPMISTDENDQIVAQVYTAFTPYLYYYDPKADKLTDYVMQNSKDCITCTRDTQFASIISQIESLQASAVGKKDGYNGDELKKLLQSYKNQQDDLIKGEKALGIDVLDRTEHFSSSLTVKGVKQPFQFKIDFSWKGLLELPADSIIKTFEGYRDRAVGASNKAENQVVIDTYKKIIAKQQEIQSQYPKLKDIKTDSLNVVKQIGENRDTAEKIALQEKKFYDEMYRQKQSLNTDEPCRKIVF